MRTIPDNTLRYPVLITLENGATASGFYLNDQDKSLYFVTARHVLFERNNKSLTPILKSNKATLLSYPDKLEMIEPIEIELQLDILNKGANIISHVSEEVDVIVVRVFDSTIKNGGCNLAKLVEGTKVTKGKEIFSKGGRLLVAELESIRKYNDVLISDDVFIFGYPTSLGIRSNPQIEYLKPLLRKGTIAGKNDQKKTIILDCPIYYGNSGGPVIEVEQIDPARRTTWVIGVVSQFVPFIQEWYNIKHDYVNTNIENSGYSIVTPMDTVFDLINKKS